MCERAFDGRYVGSVTRFGENSPLLQTFTSLWQIFDNLFLTWQNAESTLAIFDIIGQIFIAENDRIKKKQSGHLVTLYVG